MIESKIRKWGNSYGVLISKGDIEKKNLGENEEVIITIKKKMNLEKLFGICKFKRPTIEIMKEIKEGYND